MHVSNFSTNWYHFVNFIYFHGYNSGPDVSNTKVQFLKQFGTTQLVDARPDYSPESYTKSVENLIDSNQQNIFVGSSLGGYWAYLMAQQYDASFILFNPAIDPHKTLKSLGDRHTAYFYKYKELTLMSSLHKKSIVFLASDDPIVRSESTVNLLDKAIGEIQVFLINSKDHRLADIDQYQEKLFSFLKEIRYK